MKNIAKIIIPLIIAIGLVWVIFLFVDFDSIVAKLKQANPELINELCNTLINRLGNSFRIYLELETLKEKAKNLIVLIRKEYHLE